MARTSQTPPTPPTTTPASPPEGGQTWIAFLRAVNVGGRKVEMARLRELLGAMGLGRVRTYIASGNVFFDAALDTPQQRAELTGAIQARLREEFGFEVPTILRSIPEVEAALAAAPFDQVEIDPDVRLNIVFLSGPLTGLKPPLRSPKDDWELLDATDGEAFVVAWRLNGRVGSNPVAAIEKAYGVQATGRFFHTTAKIVEAAKKP
ncbi:DUF1697 domain-containing protein [Streptacidiphilus sp. PB12-B1b]|uniref:DUF1697 domain-containing protein n=1 Tax=Streptacidiphilus sp. PB12-B1b TaxID=2705012 RepID=UPI0015FCA55E|nr:DUF1697 domain-containing protein [Streptacidiphilus sp. PB12-B1b]QMU75662.1 DUF1697 domain-containing protein [Streptacidiphilus sp. PB12-B1b]